MKNETLRTIAINMYNSAMHHIDNEVYYADSLDDIRTYGCNETSFEVDGLDVFIKYDYEFDTQIWKGDASVGCADDVEILNVRVSICDIDIMQDCEDYPVTAKDIEQINAYAA